MRYKSKRSRECDIPIEVKLEVYERDNHRCVICGSNQGVPNGHYKRRTQGGLGIPQNIVTLCPKCHKEFDNGFKREEIGNYIANYLKSIYGATWCETDLIYNKWKDFKIK